ncbi:hypothetical protein OGATHE_002795 [Ogataea polymorpha]|uniref:Uncharacterized protein n=1 Tax=Ogataea polymorpha TaxID=460523 RepID=A0A9P8PDQ9_9ASCO|nr:hypothetical protein OGATHE_002795 [Ogataea polymorpha]
MDLADFGFQARGVRVDLLDIQLLKLSQNRSDFQTLLQIVVLVGINQLQVFTSSENDSMVLVIRLTVSQNWVSGKLNSELRSSSTILHDFTVSVDQSREDSWFISLIERWFFIQVSDLQIWVSTKQELRIFKLFRLEFGQTLHRNNKLELSSSHSFKLSLQSFSITTKHLNNLRVFNTVEKLDSSGVVHETRNSSVQGLRSQRSPNSGSQSVLWSSRLETNAVEWQVINFVLHVVLILLLTILKCSRFLSQNLGVLNETIPLDWMKLFQVFKQGDSRKLIILSNNFSQGKQDLFGVVRSENSKGRHVIHRQWFRNRCGQRLSKERDTSFGFRVSWEELRLEVVIILRNKESWCSQCALALNFGWNLVVKQLLNVINRQQMLSSGKDVSPRCQNGNTQVERSSDRKQTVDQNVPHVSIQEEQHQVGSHHQAQSDSSLLFANDIAVPLFSMTPHRHSGQVPDWISQRQNQEEIRFDVFGEENQKPQEPREVHVQSLQTRERGGESL